MYQNPPGLIRVYQKPNKTPRIIGGIAVAAIVAYSFWNFYSNRVVESNIPKKRWEAAQVQPVRTTPKPVAVNPCPIGKPFRKTVPVTIPKYKVNLIRERIAELKRLKVKEETIEGLITTFEIENPHWNHKAIGGFGERGYGQNLPDVVEDTIERALKTPNGNRTNNAIAHYIIPIVRTFSIQTRKDYIDGSWLKKKLARKRIRNYVYKRLIQDENADWDISTAVYLHDTIRARNACRDYHVPFGPAVTDSHHNAPERTKDALKHCGTNFLHCRELPTITKNRRFPTFYVPRGLTGKPKPGAKH